MITLIIIDCQYDFINGSLAVKGAKRALDNIKRFIIKHRDIDKIIFTVDWHHINHCSFKENGGSWPIHCVQYSKGASIDERLMDLVHEHNIKYGIIVKGTDPSREEYGAFNIPPFNNCFVDGHHTVFFNECSDIVVCGIAGDYCVKETLKNIINIKPKVFLKGVASIDNGITIKNFITENKLEIVK